ncbi:MAG TPA: hypothetical protein VFD43_03860 [Planctomycetota bacterium]|nr:hypothetical protein [Planctomycetota bacterium]
MRSATVLTRALALAALLGAGDLARALPMPSEKTLWVSDDVSATIYHITLDGAVLSSFHSGSISELALGVGDDADTLWAAKEGSNLITHFDLAGATLGSFPGTAYDPAAAAPEGVAVDFADGTLWVVDDLTDRVYHVDQAGTPISSFPTTGFDPSALSPQGIACDPADGSLWIVDNLTHAVYHVTPDGIPLSSFPASAFGPVTLNLQGIDVDGDDDSIWLTARNTHLIYNVSPAGVLQSTLDTALFGSLDPTGVAVQPADPWTDLGQGLAGAGGAPLLAGSGSLAALPPVTMSLTNALPSAPALLLVGLSALNAPLKGGVLVPSPDMPVMLGTDPSGEVQVATLWPDGLPGGLQLWIQWWIVDPSGPAGFTASNALLATTPAP